MRTIFMARGPSFQAGYKQPWMKLVDVFQCLAHSVGLDHSEGHEGDWDRVKNMFKETNSTAKSGLKSNFHLSF
jgi:hypothetical protein